MKLHRYFEQVETSLVELESAESGFFANLEGNFTALLALLKSAYMSVRDSSRIQFELARNNL